MSFSFQSFCFCSVLFLLLNKKVIIQKRRKKKKTPPHDMLTHFNADVHPNFRTTREGMDGWVCWEDISLGTRPIKNQLDQITKVMFLKGRLTMSKETNLYIYIYTGYFVHPSTLSKKWALRTTSTYDAQILIWKWTCRIRTLYSILQNLGNGDKALYI